MAIEVKLPHITEEEALRIIINSIKREKTSQYEDYNNSNYGHDLYIPQIITECLQKEMNKARGDLKGMVQFSMDPNQKGSEVFYDAAWSLCRNGIIRPNPPNVNSTLKGYDSGRGFSITNYGKKWSKDVSDYDCVPAEFGRFGSLLAKHSTRFGDGYHSRSQEALSCYRSHTYLACCAMCGASAESIMLALAIAKDGNEESILAIYKSASGRSKIENLLLGMQKDRIKQEFQNFMSLLKYWRDTAAHGALSNIGEEEAFTSILLLLRFARFADINWAELTT